MNQKYDGRGLAEDEVDKLEREDDYNNKKALKEARTNRDIKRLELETSVIGKAPWICSILFLGAVTALWSTGQRTSAVTLTVSTFTGVSGYVFGNKGNRNRRK